MTLNLEPVSDLNLVRFYLDELRLFVDGEAAKEIWTSSQRKTLRKHGILAENKEGWGGRGLYITEYGQRLIEQAQRHGGDA